jgi:pSer/pThr/pTyr-binding forkhead associated (FHA) protein
MQLLTPKASRHALATCAGCLAIDGVLLPLRGDVTRLGRSITADVEIDAASVSRRHAMIVWRDGEMVLLDDGSLNGTWHNGERVEQAILRDGDLIGLGEVTLRYLTAQRFDAVTDPLLSAV